MQNRFLALWPLLFAIACGGGGGDEPDPGGGDPGGGNATVFFAQDILPIFGTDCINCHGTSGGLDLQSWDGVDAGGNSGAVVVPGDPENSLLIQRLEGTIAPRMPQNLPPLSPAEIDVIKQWIREGALDN
ncbi:MAG: c-type cytochrome domain-containing protein [Planctomycetota bacterium]|jgi:hypothetical protein